MNCLNCNSIEKYSGYNDSSIDYTCSTCVQIMIQPTDMREWARKITERNGALGLQLITRSRTTKNSSVSS